MLLACSRRHGAIAESTQTNCGQIFKYQGLAGEAVCDYGAWIGTGGQQQSGFRRSYYSEDDGRVISQAHRFWQDYLLKESYLLPSPASCQSDDDCPQDRFAAKPPAPDPKKGGAWGKMTPAHYGEAFLTVDAGVCGSKAIKITVDKLHITDARIADEDRVTVYTGEPYEPEAVEVKAATFCGRGKMVVSGIRGYVGGDRGPRAGAAYDISIAAYATTEGYTEDSAQTTAADHFGEAGDVAGVALLASGTILRTRRAKRSV
ncbi:MAG: hypothetical protein J6D34_11940 [Atopobiaceae bacterium]|nr:hypothetical protein [Atopobiaceae bacterium]